MKAMTPMMDNVAALEEEDEVQESIVWSDSEGQDFFQVSCACSVLY
jgi:hypothetical protein